MNLRPLLTPFGLLTALVACTGASESELFSTPDSTQLGNQPAAPGDGSDEEPGADGTGSSSSGSSSSGSSSGGSSSSGSSSGGSSSGGSSSGGSTSGGVKDAGGPPATGGSIHCGTSAPGATACSAGAEVCCGTWTKPNKVQFACEPAGPLACAGGRTIACDDRTDCPAGQVCCGTLEEYSGYTSVQCKTTCTSPPGTRAVRFCDPDAPIDECAQLGKYCGPSQSLPGYNVCRD